MRLRAIGRVALWAGGVTSASAVLLVLLYSPLDDGPWAGTQHAARTSVLLCMPMLVWLSAFWLDIMLHPGAYRGGDEYLRVFGYYAVGTSAAAVAVGLMVQVYQVFNPLPPSSPHSARYALALTLMPAGSLLAGMAVASAWGRAARSVRVMNPWSNAKRRKRAFIIKLSDPELTDAQVAERAGVSRISLFRWPEYLRLKRHAELRGRDRRRFKTGDGRIEGFDEDDGEVD